MMRGISVRGCVGVLVALPCVAVAQERDFEAVTIETVPVAEGVYMLRGYGGNLGLSVGPDAPFLVDDQFAPLTAKITAAIAAVDEKPVGFVLNTHWHGDHTGGNENLGAAGAIIVAHENVRRRMNPSQFADVMGRSEQAAVGALPVVTFTDAVTFHWNDQTIEVTHVAHAHTDGDAVVRFVEANVIHMGDIFFNGRYPFIDVESGGNVHGVIAAADHVLRSANSHTRIIPGHGDLNDADGLRAYRDMLVVVRDRVQTMHNDGLSADEIVAHRPTADFDAAWTSDPERFVRAVVHSVR